MKAIIHNTLLNQESGIGKAFDIFILVLIVLSVASFSIETLPDLPDNTREFLQTLEVLFVSVFTIEYLLRLYVAERKLAYIFSFYGLIDLLSILPFYLSGTVSLQALRILRLLRIFRLLKLARYNRAVNRIKKAVVEAKEELVLFSIVTLILLYLSAVGIYFFEHEAQPEHFRSIFDSLWWSVATLTTVGYGDVYPITMGGRLFTFIVLMLGLGVVAVPTGIIATSLASVHKRTE